MPALGAVAATTGTYADTQDQVVKTGPYIQNTPTPASYATAGNQTYTVADIIGTIIVRTSGADRVDVLPTAALMVAALGGNGPHAPARVGDTVYCLIINGGTTNKITITGGAGGTLDPNQNAATAIIPQNTSKEIAIRLTATAIGSEAYVFYS